jgi:hypothetical protein
MEGDGTGGGGSDTPYVFNPHSQSGLGGVMAGYGTADPDEDEPEPTEPKAEESTVPEPVVPEPDVKPAATEIPTEPKVEASEVKYKEFVEMAKQDFAGAYKKYRAELGLPNADIVARALSSDTTVETRLNQYREAKIKEIEKANNMDEGEFEWNDADSFKAGTPTYKLRKALESYEREIESQHAKEIEAYNNEVNIAMIQQGKDVEELASIYFPADTDEAKAASVTKVKDMVAKLSTLPPQEPFRLKTLLRGVFFEDFMKIEINKLNEAYRKAGVKVPDMPTAAGSNIHTAEVKPAPASGNSKSYSPLNYIIENS